MKIKDEFGTVPRTILLIVLITIGFADMLFLKENVPPIARLICFLLWFICILVSVLLYGKNYEISENGLVVIWCGIVSHTYQWEFFSEIAVYKLHRYCLDSHIVCSKSGWSKKRKAMQWFLLQPFSAFSFEYTPERFQAVTKYYDRATYVLDREEADRLYESRRTSKS